MTHYTLYLTFDLDCPSDLKDKCTCETLPPWSFRGFFIPYGKWVLSIATQIITYSQRKSRKRILYISVNKWPVSWPLFWIMTMWCSHPVLQVYSPCMKANLMVVELKKQQWEAFQICPQIYWNKVSKLNEGLKVCYPYTHSLANVTHHNSYKI